MRTTTFVPTRWFDLFDEAWFRIVVGLTGLLALGLAASEEEGAVLCPFRRCTGGYCPGCGVTRSTGALLRGDIARSWHHHPILLLAVGQAVALLGLWALAGGRLRARLRSRTGALLAANGALILAIWVVRLAAGHIPIPFVN